MQCNECDNSGSCEICDGYGTVLTNDIDPQATEIDCPACEGSGVCPDCYGADTTTTNMEAVQ